MQEKNNGSCTEHSDNSGRTEHTIAVVVLTIIIAATDNLTEAYISIITSLHKNIVGNAVTVPLRIPTRRECVTRGRAGEL